MSGSAAVPGWRGPAGGAGYGRIAAFEAHVLRVLIASPGDTTDERGAVERSLHGWNASRAEREQVILLPARWETDAVPRLGGSGQSVINEQLVDRADIMIALFDSRLGQAAEEAVSGAAEEIQRAHEAEAGKPVHVYFSEEPLPRNVDEKQLAAPRKFQASLEFRGLLGRYANPEALGFQVRNAVEHDLEHLSLGAVAPRRRAGETLSSAPPMSSNASPKQTGRAGPGSRRGASGSVSPTTARSPPRKSPSLWSRWATAARLSSRNPRSSPTSSRRVTTITR